MCSNCSKLITYIKNDLINKIIKSWACFKLNFKKLFHDIALNKMMTMYKIMKQQNETKMKMRNLMILIKEIHVM